METTNLLVGFSTGFLFWIEGRLVYLNKPVVPQHRRTRPEEIGTSRRWKEIKKKRDKERLSKEEAEERGFTDLDLITDRLDKPNRLHRGITDISIEARERLRDIDNMGLMTRRMRSEADLDVSHLRRIDEACSRVMRLNAKGFSKVSTEFVSAAATFLDCFEITTLFFKQRAKEFKGGRSWDFDKDKILDEFRNVRQLVDPIINPENQILVASKVFLEEKKSGGVVKKKSLWERLWWELKQELGIREKRKKWEVVVEEKPKSQRYKETFETYEKLREYYDSIS